MLPIATCEIQGYVYDAKLRLAELADGPFADPTLARRLRDRGRHPARAVQPATSGSTERGGYYAVGLDGDKHRDRLA